MKTHTAIQLLVLMVAVSPLTLSIVSDNDKNASPMRLSASDATNSFFQRTSEPAIDTRWLLAGNTACNPRAQVCED